MELIQILFNLKKKCWCNFFEKFSILFFNVFTLCTRAREVITRTVNIDLKRTLIHQISKIQGRSNESYTI